MEKARRDSGLPFQKVEGRIVIVVPSRREVHELDEVATFLWEELQDPRSVSQLVRALCDKFEVEPGDAERDVRRFLSTLEEKGLVLAG